jgi:hypothetical protein
MATAKPDPGDGILAEKRAAKGRRNFIVGIASAAGSRKRQGPRRVACPNCRSA